jgi:hypothetical protein
VGGGMALPGSQERRCSWDPSAGWLSGRATRGAVAEAAEATATAQMTTWRARDCCGRTAGHASCHAPACAVRRRGEGAEGAEAVRHARGLHSAVSSGYCASYPAQWPHDGAWATQWVAGGARAPCARRTAGSAEGFGPALGLATLIMLLATWIGAAARSLRPGAPRDAVEMPAKPARLPRRAAPRQMQPHSFPYLRAAGGHDARKREQHDSLELLLPVQLCRLICLDERHAGLIGRCHAAKSFSSQAETRCVRKA